MPEFQEQRGKVIALDEAQFDDVADRQLREELARCEREIAAIVERHKRAAEEECRPWRELAAVLERCRTRFVPVVELSEESARAWDEPPPRSRRS